MSFSFDIVDGDVCIRVDGKDVTDQVGDVGFYWSPDLKEPIEVIMTLRPRVQSTDMADGHQLMLRPSDAHSTVVDVLRQLDAREVELVADMNTDMSTSPTQGVIDAIIGVLTPQE